MIRRVSLFLLMALGLGLTGCGEAVYPVSGGVKLDGAPVAGAMVTFCSDDGKTFAATTDDSGTFKLVSGEKPGIPAGNYKVLVVKTPPVSGATEGMQPGGADYMKMVETNKKEQDKKDKAGMVMPKGMPGPGGMKGMMPMPGGGGHAQAPKSELPAQYASITTTPVSFTVPLQNNPVTIDIAKGKDSKDPKKK